MKKEIAMKLIKDKELLRNIACQIDLLNTIGGGVSETYVNIKKYKKGAVIEVQAAGVATEAYKVVLQNNTLTVASMLQNPDNLQMAMPLFYRTFLLPPQVDLGRIEAIHQEGRLLVKLPYHEAADKPREIEIKQL